MTFSLFKVVYTIIFISFPEEIHRLREELRGRERDNLRMEPSPGAERRMEQWRREVGRELSSLREDLTSATSLCNLEERCYCNTELLKMSNSSRVKKKVSVIFFNFWASESEMASFLSLFQV